VVKTYSHPKWAQTYSSNLTRIRAEITAIDQKMEALRRRKEILEDVRRREERLEILRKRTPTRFLR
jgi:prefoldin subunit 5